MTKNNGCAFEKRTLSGIPKQEAREDPGPDSGFFFHLSLSQELTPGNQCPLRKVHPSDSRKCHHLPGLPPGDRPVSDPRASERYLSQWLVRIFSSLCAVRGDDPDPNLAKRRDRSVTTVALKGPGDLCGSLRSGRIKMQPCLISNLCFSAHCRALLLVARGSLGPMLSCPLPRAFICFASLGLPPCSAFSLTGPARCCRDQPVTRSSMTVR